VLMQVMVTFSLIVVLWFVYGYSLAFTEGNAFVGGMDRLMMKGIWDNVGGTFANAATFSKGVYIPEIVFAAFQATFAGITCCLIVGAFAERIKFSAVHGAVVHLQLRPDRSHGLVLDGPRRLRLQGRG